MTANRKSPPLVDGSDRAGANLETGRRRRPPRKQHPMPGAGPIATVSAESPDPEQLRAWDRLVRSVPLADVVQLSAWARLRARAGYRPTYVFATQEDRLVGGAQILERRIPGFGRVGYLSNGPLVSQDTEAPDAVRRALTDAVTSLGRTRLRAVFVQPPEGAPPASTEWLDRGFRRSDAGIAPVASLRIDLSVDVEQLRRNLSKDVRKAANRWGPRGVTVRCSTVEDADVLAELLASTTRRQSGSVLFGSSYLAAMYEELSGDGEFVGFLGEVAGSPVAMKLLTGCGGVLRSRMKGFRPTEGVRQFNVPAAVEWAAITWAKEQGYRWYDFGGVLPESLPALADGEYDVDALPGPDRYKVRFGAHLCRYPTPVEFIRPAVVRWTYDLSRRTGAGRKAVNRLKHMAQSGATGWSRRAAGPPRRP
ncbi:lipid II:glycine glycyltransferase FemX [Geodermatophilus sp. SYSU D00965]